MEHLQAGGPWKACKALGGSGRPCKLEWPSSVLGDLEQLKKLECCGDWEAGLSGLLVLKVASEKASRGALRGLEGPSKKNGLEDTAVRPKVGSRAASPAGFGAFALLDGTQFRFQVFGFRVQG